MRLLRLDLRDYKGLEAHLDLRSSVTVFFGPNDTGKTNLLEAIAGGLASGLNAGPVDPQIARGATERSVTAGALVELDGLFTPGHPDRALLAELIQFAPEDLDLRPRTVRTGGSRRRGRSNPPFVGDEQVKLPSNPQLLTDLLAHLRTEIMRIATKHASSWAEVRGDFDLLLEECLRSRWLYWGGPTTGVAWLAPAAADCSDEVHAAATRLAAKRDRWKEWPPPPLEQFIATLLGDVTETQGTFLDIGGEMSRSPRIWEPVWLVDTTSGLAELARSVETYVLWRSSPGWVRRGDRIVGWARHTRSPWIEEVPAEDESSGNYRLSSEVAHICTELSQRATLLAPLFIAEKYSIEVRSKPPDRWDEQDEPAHLDIALIGPAGEERSLPEVGSGIATWAAVSIREAARRLRQDFVSGRGRLPSRDAATTSELPDQAVPARREGPPSLADSQAANLDAPEHVSPPPAHAAHKVLFGTPRDEPGERRRVTQLVRVHVPEPGPPSPAGPRLPILRTSSWFPDGRAIGSPGQHLDDPAAPGGGGR